MNIPCKDKSSLLFQTMSQAVTSSATNPFHKMTIEFSSRFPASVYFGNDPCREELSPIRAFICPACIIFESQANSGKQKWLKHVNHARVYLQKRYFFGLKFICRQWRACRVKKSTNYSCIESYQSSWKICSRSHIPRNIETWKTSPCRETAEWKKKIEKKENK